MSHDLLDKAYAYTKSIEAHRRALATREKLYAPQHASVCESLNNLGIVLAMSGDFEEGESLVARALAIESELSGRDHPSATKTRRNLEAIQKDRLKREQAMGGINPEKLQSLTVAQAKTLAQYDGALISAVSKC